VIPDLPHQNVERRNLRLARLADRLPVGEVITAQLISIELGVSERTVYRYIARLRAAGIPISGEAGVGYMLRRRPS